MRNIMIIMAYFIGPWIGLGIVIHLFRKGLIEENKLVGYIGLFSLTGIINTIGLFMLWGWSQMILFLIIFLVYEGSQYIKWAFAVIGGMISVKVIRFLFKKEE